MYDADPASVSHRPRRGSKHRAERSSGRRVRIAGRCVVTALALGTLAATGVAWDVERSADRGFNQVEALDVNSPDIVDPGGQLGDEVYLLVGTDSRAGANGDVGAGSSDDFGDAARSDTVMLVDIPANRQRVVVTSFPRDLDVARPECQGWDNDNARYTGDVYPAATGVKLNAAYALGGPRCLVKVIQKLSGIRIGHFIGIDFSGFQSMVDDVGGVQVCTPSPLVDGELGTVLASAGSQTIDGATALDYVRARHVASEGNSDYGRVKRQQRFLSSLLRSALSNDMLLDPGKLNDFIGAFTADTFVENVTTRDLVSLGQSLRNVDAGAVTFLTVPTLGTNAAGNEIPDRSGISALFRAVIDDQPLPGEHRAGPTAAGTTPLSGTAATPRSTRTDTHALDQVSAVNGADTSCV